MVYCLASQRLRLPPASSTKSRVVSPTWPSLYREPLRLFGVLPRHESCTHDLGQHYPALVATPGSCARPPPSPVLRTTAWYASLCRLPRAPCWAEALPDVLASISVEVLGPVPRRASAVLLPVSSRSTSASPYVQEVRRAETPAMMATSMTNRFRGCSHAVMFRLPHLLDPQVAPTAEARSPLGSRAVYTTPCTCGYPPRTVVSLRA
jgi:hypothetical protein